jgi:hypothetical protein
VNRLGRRLLIPTTLSFIDLDTKNRSVDFWSRFETLPEGVVNSILTKSDDLPDLPEDYSYEVTTDATAQLGRS